MKGGKRRRNGTVEEVQVDTLSENNWCPKQQAPDVSINYLQQQMINGTNNLWLDYFKTEIYFLIDQHIYCVHNYSNIFSTYTNCINKSCECVCIADKLYETWFISWLFSRIQSGSKICTKEFLKFSRILIIFQFFEKFYNFFKRICR